MGVDRRMLDINELALADRAAVYFFHHYDPELCYSALTYCENSHVIEAISQTLPVDEADCGTWSGKDNNALEKRADFLVKAIGDRQTVEKLIVDSDSAAAFKAELQRENGNKQPISPKTTKNAANQSPNIERDIGTICPTSEPIKPALSSFLGDGTPLKSEQVEALKRLNEDYTHVTIGGKHKVVMKKPCQTNGVTHSFEDLGQFRNYFLHRERIEGHSLGAAWLKWPSKHYKPDGVGFYPVPQKCPNTVFNLFMGFGVTAKDGDVSPYLYHLERVICAGDQVSYAYLLGWLAHLVQKPDEKPSVAIVMKSVEGTGKGTMVEPLARILGPHFTHINGHGQIAGRFNSAIANKLLIFADEVDLTDYKVADKLKGLISEPTISLERKGIEPEPLPNYGRFIFASNRDQVIKAGLRERRYLVLEPDSLYAQDMAYFQRLRAWIANGGAEALFHYLSQLDISTFSPYKAPTTRALLDEKLASLKPSEMYLFTELSSEKPFNGANRLYVRDLVDSFRRWSEEQTGEVIKPSSAQTQMGRLMVRAGAQVQGRSDRGSGKFYDLCDVDIKAGFAQIMGQSVKDVFPD